MEVAMLTGRLHLIFSSTWGDPGGSTS